MEKRENENNSSTFLHFSNLPPELRSQIWRDALDLNVGLRPALYAFKKGCWCPRWLTPSDEGFDAEHPDLNLMFEFRYDLLDKAQIEVPVALVNKEAQGIALTWAKELNPQISVHMDGYQPVFLRSFDPLQDALYVAQHQWDDFLREPGDRQCAFDMVDRQLDVQSAVRHIAMPEELVSEVATTLGDLFFDYWNVKKLYIIVGEQPDFSLQTASNTISDTTTRNRRPCECKSSRRVAL